MKIIKRFPVRYLLIGMVILLIANLVWMAMRSNNIENSAASTATQIAVDSQTQVLPGVVTTPLPVESTYSPGELFQNLSTDGVFIFSMADGLYFHLFAFHPKYLPFTRLTNDEWDDCYPSLSPDGTKLAYASRRNGYWDIYILDLVSAELTRLTDTPAFDNHPTWSPDGQWIAYESYVDENLDIFVQSTTDQKQPVLRLTDDPASDFAPTWSPKGRTVAFVSTRSGNEDIWLASLDQTENRYTNLTQTPDEYETNPAWSPDGSLIAWAMTNGNTTTLWQSDLDSLPRQSGDGSLPFWNMDSTILGGVLQTPNENYLVAYAASDSTIKLQAVPLWGEVRGIVWAKGVIPEILADPKSGYTAAQQVPLWQVVVEASPLPPAGRSAIVPLNNIEAPYPMLHDDVDEAFSALQVATGQIAGWDFLASLENAYLPLTQPLSPGLPQDWLLTGRAIAVNPLSMYAGWLVVQPEMHYGLTYWRVFIKARYQDGSQGSPVAGRVWDFTSRYSGDTVAYEQGGTYINPPSGYWVDFTSLAQRFGWSRLPAEGNWRTFFPGARFNQFVLTDGLSWHASMAQIYPPEAIATVTITPSPMPSPTVKPPINPSAQPSPTITPTATNQPTFTPKP